MGFIWYQLVLWSGHVASKVAFFDSAVVITYNFRGDMGSIPVQDNMFFLFMWGESKVMLHSLVWNIHSRVVGLSNKIQWLCNS